MDAAPVIENFAPLSVRWNVLLYGPASPGLAATNESDQLTAETIVDLSC